MKGNSNNKGEFTPQIQENWKKIHPNFNSEMQESWKEQGFDYEDTQKWIEIGLKVSESGFAYWLKVEKELTASDLNNQFESRINGLRGQYKQWARQGIQKYQEFCGEKTIEVKCYSCKLKDCPTLYISRGYTEFIGEMSSKGERGCLVCSKKLNCSEGDYCINHNTPYYKEKCPICWQETYEAGKIFLNNRPCSKHRKKCQWKNCANIIYSIDKYCLFCKQDKDKKIKCKESGCEGMVYLSENYCISHNPYSFSRHYINSDSTQEEGQVSNFHRCRKNDCSRQAIKERGYCLEHTYELIWLIEEKLNIDLDTLEESLKNEIGEYKSIRELKLHAEALSELSQKREDWYRKSIQAEKERDEEKAKREILERENKELKEKLLETSIEIKPYGIKKI